MTDPKSPESARTGISSKSFSIDQLNGKYAYRFNGYVMAYNIRYYLVGVGHFEIRSHGQISGRHRSSLSPLQGQQACLTTGVYDLEGTIKVDQSGSGEAKIRFTKVSGEGEPLLDGKFFVQVAGSADRLWFISSGATLPNSKGAKADELVTLEAVRMAGT
jgi:hypothetical protein